MYVQDVNDAMCCQYFPATLRGIAQKWFNSLLSGSTTSFLLLVELFSPHFVVGKRKRKTSIHIAKIRQAKGEDLKKYVMRFNREVNLVSDLQDRIAYDAFLNGLLPGRFKFFLVESITILVDVLRRAQDFIQAIEICVGDDFIWQDAWKRVEEDNDSQLNKQKEGRGDGWMISHQPLMYPHKNQRQSNSKVTQTH